VVQPHRVRIGWRNLMPFIVAASMFGIAPLGAATGPAMPDTAGVPFVLTAPDGAVVTDKTYRGKWLVVYFGYTFCPDICPTTLSAIAGALEALGPEAAVIQPLFITLDPGRDTPQLLGEFVKAFDPRIVALRGTPAQTGAIAQGYGVIYQRDDGDKGGYLYEHTSYVYVMNPEGRFIEAIAGDADGGTIARRLSELMPKGSGTAAAE
jgi:protein SCO1/2